MYFVTLTSGTVALLSKSLSLQLWVEGEEEGVEGAQVCYTIRAARLVEMCCKSSGCGSSKGDMMVGFPCTSVIDIKNLPLSLHFLVSLNCEACRRRICLVTLHSCMLI